MSGFWTCFYVSIDDSIRGSHVPVRSALQCERDLSYVSPPGLNELVRDTRTVGLERLNVHKSIFSSRYTCAASVGSYKPRSNYHTSRSVCMYARYADKRHAESPSPPKCKSSLPQSLQLYTPTPRNPLLSFYCFLLRLLRLLDRAGLVVDRLHEELPLDELERLIEEPV